MGRIIQVLMTRDGMSETEAILFYNTAMAEVNEAIDEGDYHGASLAFEESFGFDPDNVPEVPEVCYC